MSGKRLALILALALSFALMGAGIPRYGATISRPYGENWTHAVTGISPGNGPSGQVYLGFDDFTTNKRPACATQTQAIDGVTVCAYPYDQAYGVYSGNNDFVHNLQYAFYASPMYLTESDPRFGNGALEVRAGTTTCLLDSIRSCDTDMTAGKSFYLSAWFKITADDTSTGSAGVAESDLSPTVIISIKSNAEVYDLIRFSKQSDTFSSIVGTTGSDWSLGDAPKFKEIVNSGWHHVAALAVGETTPASSSDGKIKLWFDFALMDSASNINWSANAQEFYFASFVPRMAVDAGRNMKVFFDDVYMSTGHATTIDNRGYARVELGNKITYGNCTRRYVQRIIEWSVADGRVIFRNTGDFRPGEKAYIFIIKAGSVGGLPATTATDSLIVPARVYP